MNIINELNTFFETTGIKIIQAIAVLVIGILVIKFIMKFINKLLKRKRKDNALGSFLSSLILAGFYVFLAYIIFSILELSTTSFVAVVSAIGLAVALSLKDSLSSLANGIVIITTKPFMTGDYVDINGTSGTVKSVKLFNTKLVTIDNTVVILPNSSITSEKIINYSAKSTRRIDLKIDIAYGTKIDKVKEVISQVVSDNKMALKYPEPFIRLLEMSTSSIVFAVRVWSSNDNFWDLKYDLMEAIYNALQDNNIEIPFNQCDITIKNIKEMKAIPLQNENLEISNNDKKKLYLANEINKIESKTVNNDLIKDDNLKKVEAMTIKSKPINKKNLAEDDMHNDETSELFDSNSSNFKQEDNGDK